MAKDTFLKTFLPWLCFAGLSFLGFPKLGAPSALIALALGSWFLGCKPVDVVLMIYFAAVAVGIGLFHWAWLGQLQPVLAPGMLAAMAFGTVLIRRPFTLPYARESVKDPAMWTNPHFYRVNYILSILWGSAFVLAALGQAWALGRPGLIWIASVGAFLCTGAVALFTLWFPPWYYKNIYLPLNPEQRATG